MRTLASFFAGAAIIVAGQAMAQDAAGDWRGVLEVAPGSSLPLVVHIRREAGALSGTMDSPAQGAADLPLAEIVNSSGRLAFKVPSVGGEFEAAWDEAAKSWKGQWRQAGMKWPLALAAPLPPQPLPANWAPPGSHAIDKLIAARIAGRKGQALVVGVVEPLGRRVIAGGPATGETLFEIGSITKVFTALLLADMANRGVVKLDDPAQQYLPAGSRMPERGGRKITLADLATHTSGLPRLPDNMPYNDPADPYADYTEALLLEFLAEHELTRDIGSKMEYSNLGVGLLGYLLGRAAGLDYATLLQRRITGPLRLSDTVVTLSDRQKARFTTGHDLYMQPAKPWHTGVLTGAGAVRSSTKDMLAFAAAVLDPKSPIAAAVKTALSVRRPSANPRSEQALGWQVLHLAPGRDILAHDGGTGGFRSVLLLEPGKQRAVVVLASSAAEPSVGDLAMHVLAGRPVAATPPVPPAPPPRAARTAASLAPAELDRVVGRYTMPSGAMLTIMRRRTGLAAQLTGQPPAPIFAEAPLRFFYRVVDAQLRFTADAGGAVTGMELDQNGRTLSGKRVGP